MLNIYICFNQISYVVACEHARSHADASQILFIDRRRVVEQGRYAGLRHRSMTRWGLLRALLAVAFRRASRVYVPHDRGGRLVRILRLSAGSYGLVDDGLDTLRECPNNIDPNTLPEYCELLTFEDYEELASWTRGLPVRRVTRLALLLVDDRPVFPVGSARALVVQSPGVDAATAASTLGITDSEVLVVLHNSPAKRLPVPASCRSVEARDRSVEKTVLSFDGLVLSGDTMVTVVSLYLRPSARLVVALTAEQFANLKCLHGRLAGSGVRLVVQGIAT